MEILIIGIAGGSGSGKSTLTDKLYSKFSDNATVIRHDDYYNSQDGLTMQEREKQNYDCPQAFETALLIEHLKRLRKGETVDIPVYDYSLHNRSGELRRIKPCKLILIDGILILENEELCSLMDIKIFVDTDADIRILRRIERDVQKRGRSLTSIIRQYNETVKPMYEKYVHPSRRKADMVILNGGYNEVALEILESRIQRHISE